MTLNWRLSVDKWRQWNNKKYGVAENLVWTGAWLGSVLILTSYNIVILFYSIASHSHDTDSEVLWEVFISHRREEEVLQKLSFLFFSPHSLSFSLPYDLLIITYLLDTADTGIHLFNQIYNTYTFTFIGLEGSAEGLAQVQNISTLEKMTSKN
jgi:hypothetical protein